MDKILALKNKKMNLKWRKWFRIIHRDFGYLFFGMTIIYAISGIAINHINDWNPNYVITTKEIKFDMPAKVDKAEVMKLLKSIDEENNYKNFYFPGNNRVKIFLQDGSIIANLTSGEALMEKVKRRPILREMNYLHYNPIKWFTWFSDLFAGALILLAITGLFLLKGKKGITGRGAWLTALGIIIPIAFLIIYFY